MTFTPMRIPHAIACLLLSFFLCPGFLQGQVVAGIKANGVALSQGDTVNVCKGSRVFYESAASGSLVIQWRFNSGTPTQASGIAPVSVLYNATGYDTTFQRVEGSNGFSDSAFIIVRVSDEFPAAAFDFNPDNVCGNIPIQFTSNATGQAPLLYAWNFADNDTTAFSTANPAHQFLSAIGVSGTQTFNVKLVVTNALACKDSISKPVTVIRVPDAAIGNGGAPAISFGSFNGLATFKHCATDLFYPFQFTNTSTTASINVSYTIKWGDGTADSTFASWPANVIITHTFPRGGSNMVVMVTGVNGCIGIKKYNVFLGTNPAGGLASLGNTDICSSEPLSFNITGVDNNPPGTQYIFSINDFTTPLSYVNTPPATVSHYFPTGSCGIVSSNGSVSYANSYAAYLLITNPCGSTSPAVVPIYVSGKPRPVIAIPSPVVCINTNVLIQSASSFGNVVTSTGSTTSNCANTGKLVWEISPATYTLTSGTLGSFNGNPGNGAVWTSGSSFLNVNYTAVGVYSIKLTVYNERCGLISTIRTICVRNPPEASFTMDKKKSCGPATVALTNTSPPGGCQGNAYLWEVTYADPAGCAAGAGNGYAFASGSNANSPSPTITFTRGGRYAIRLSTIAVNAFGSCQRAFAYDTFYVVAPPVATLSGVGSICIGNSITPAASVISCYAEGPISYQWTFTGGTPAASADASPGSIGYAATGSFPLQLIVKDEGCNLSDTVNATVIVGNKPVAEAGASTAICSGAAITIGAPAVTGVTYQWFPATGVSNPGIANPNFMLIYDGALNDTTYKIFVTASQGSNCSSTDSIEITVKKRPVVTVNPATSGLCSGDSLQLTVAGADSYLWTPSASLSSAIKDTVIAKPATTTTYTVTGTAVNGCTDSKPVVVTVNTKARAQFIASATTLCAPVNLNTIITATAFPGQNSSYSWYADNVLITTSAAATFPSYIMNLPGDTIIIKLVATSAIGCKSDSMETSFITRPSVPPSFIKDKDSACAPLVVGFTNTTPVYAGTQYNWNFGNGITSTLPNPAPVSYAASPVFRDTTYYITLSVNNGCAGAVKKDSVKVFARAQARFGINNPAGCSPFTAVFTNTSRGNNTAYFWDFGDGQTLNTTNTSPISHLYTTGVIATYTVRLIAENRCGRDTQMINLQVSPSTIQVLLEANGNQLSGCAPHTVVFNNGSAGAATLTWNFGDGTPTVVTANDQAAITHTYQASGSYVVTVRLENNCSDTTIRRSITVYNKPVAGFNIVNPVVCPGTSVNFANTSQNAGSYQWLWGDGTNSNSFNGQHSYGAPGIFTVTLVASRVNPNGLICTDTMRQTVNVTAKIVAGITLPVSGTACAPYSYSASATNAGNAARVEWFVTNTANQKAEYYSTGATMAHVFNAGSYQVKLVVHTTADCADSTTVAFTVYQKPTVTINPLNAATCNHDTTIVFRASASYNGNDQLQYNWFINGVLQDAGNPWAHQFTVPVSSPEITYLVQGLAKNAQGCGDTSAASKITIYALPNPTIAVSPSVTLVQPDYTFGFRDLAAADPDKFYTWNMGDKTLRQLGGRQITYQYGDTGTFKVQLLVQNHRTGCTGKDSVSVQILYVGGYLYVPNAMCMGCANNALRRFLPLAKGLKQYRLRIYNTWGQVIFESTSLNSDGSPDEAWNGTMNGKPLQQDTYTWQIEARYKNGTEWKGMIFPGSANPVKTGFINVIK